eukprot:PhM_4_TR12798/c0_g2_i1/m.48468
MFVLREIDALGAMTHAVPYRDFLNHIQQRARETMTSPNGGDDVATTTVARIRSAMPTYNQMMFHINVKTKKSSGVVTTIKGRVSAEELGVALDLVEASLAGGHWVPVQTLWGSLPQPTRTLVSQNAFTLLLQSDPARYFMYTFTGPFVRGNTAAHLEVMHASRQHRPDFLAFVPYHWVPVGVFQGVALPSQCRHAALLFSYTRLGQTDDIVFATLTSTNKHLLRRVLHPHGPEGPAPCTSVFTSRLTAYEIPMHLIFSIAVVLPQTFVLASRARALLPPQLSCMLDEVVCSAASWTFMDLLELHPTLFELEERTLCAHINDADDDADRNDVVSHHNTSLFVRSRWSDVKTAGLFKQKTLEDVDALLLSDGRKRMRELRAKLREAADSPQAAPGLYRLRCSKYPLVDPLLKTMSTPPPTSAMAQY